MERTAKRILSYTAVVALMLVAAISAGALGSLEEPPAYLSVLSTEQIHDVLEYDLALEKGHVQRMENEEEDLNTLVYKNIDGTNTMYLYSYPVKYIDSNGDVKDKTTDFEEETKNYTAAENDILVNFNKKLSRGIGLEYDDINILMVPLFIDETGETASRLKNNNKTLQYEVDENISLEYELTFNGFKEDIILNEYTGQNEFDFILYTDGLYISETPEGELRLVNGDGEELVNIGDIIVITADERNNTRGSITYEAIEDGQVYRLTISVDEDYLLDENTAYPIRIDPTIEINYTNYGSGAIEDVTINSTGTSDGSSNSLYIGKRSGYGIARTLMKFPGLDLTGITSYDIIEAKVYLRDLMCESSAMTIECTGFTGNTWSESTASWSSVSPGSYSSTCEYTTVSYSNGASLDTVHRYGFNITSILKQMINGTNSHSLNKGIMLKASSTVESSSTEFYKTFSSYNRSSTYRPSISLTYVSTAGTSTISSQPYSITRSLTAGTKYIYQFTPSVTGRYSAWTTGSTDTYMMLYKSSMTGTPEKVDDDSGVSNNSSIIYNLQSGYTYYFVVKGYSFTTNGTYKFNFQRGLSTSGSEKPTNTSTFNSTAYKGKTSSYNYGLNMWNNPKNGSTFIINGVLPGEIAGNSISQNNLTSASTAKTYLLAAVQSDKSYYGSNIDFYSVSSEAAGIPDGYYRIAVFLDTSAKELLFARQTTNNGRWAYKINSSNDATEYDFSGNYIYDPSSADFGSYSTFVGWFAYKPPTYALSSPA